MRCHRLPQPSTLVARGRVDSARTGSGADHCRDRARSRRRSWPLATSGCPRRHDCVRLAVSSPGGARTLRRAGRSTHPVLETHPCGSQPNRAIRVLRSRHLPCLRCRTTGPTPRAIDRLGAITSRPGSRTWCSPRRRCTRPRDPHGDARRRTGWCRSTRRTGPSTGRRRAPRAPPRRPPRRAARRRTRRPRRTPARARTR